MKKKTLNVYWEKDQVGSLSLDPQKRFQFQYDKNWLQTKDAMPISVALPLRETLYEDDQSCPFFANLLPEARIRTAITRELGISENNEFGLLEAIGGECAGAISLWPSEHPFSKSGSYQAISQLEIEQWLKKRPNSPLIRGMQEKNKIRLSLAGAQSKLPVYFENQELFIPTGNYSSTHILKPPIPEFKGSVENETYCMALADRMKLGAAKSFMIQGEIQLYLTVRYDRTIVDSIVHRLHQEDFCQALKVLPQNKYESEGGPNLARCFQIVTDYSSQPLIDKLRLLKWVIFNQLIGNADAHAKNLSLLYVKKKVILAPFYDLMCTRIYPTLTNHAAMSIGGEKRLDWIWYQQWQNFSEEIGIKSSLVLETIEDLATTLPKEALALEELFQIHPSARSVLNRIRTLIEVRSAKTLKRLKKTAL